MNFQRLAQKWNTGCPCSTMGASQNLYPIFSGRVWLYLIIPGALSIKETRKNVDIYSIVLELPNGFLTQAWIIFVGDNVSAIAPLNRLTSRLKLISSGPIVHERRERRGKGAEGIYMCINVPPSAPIQVEIIKPLSSNFGGAVKLFVYDCRQGQFLR